MEKKYSILIVDDDEFLLDMYSMKFRELDFDVQIALGALDALEKIKKGLTHDILLLDVVMPNLDGFGFLEEVKKQGLLKGSKIIMLTNQGSKQDIEKGYSLGAVDYIVKAYFTPSEVAKKIEKLLLGNK